MANVIWCSILGGVKKTKVDRTKERKFQNLRKRKNVQKRKETSLNFDAPELFTGK